MVFVTLENDTCEKRDRAVSLFTIPQNPPRPTRARRGPSDPFLARHLNRTRLFFGDER